MIFTFLHFRILQRCRIAWWNNARMHKCKSAEIYIWYKRMSYHFFVLHQIKIKFFTMEVVFIFCVALRNGFFSFVYAVNLLFFLILIHNFRYSCILPIEEMWSEYQDMEVFLYFDLFFLEYVREKFQILLFSLSKLIVIFLYNILSFFIIEYM